MIPGIARTKVRVSPEVEGDHIFRSDAKAEGKQSSLGVGAAAIPMTEGNADGSP